ncbi:MAG: YegS/Rv2252/BmrU family lipid kinase [Oscillospiraceae bacterium]|nr:YegS/Rv2252/BmrU family lipid kinase [Oscillospiraceae bacterium]
MERRLLFVINPKAGRAEIKYHALAAIDSFVRAGFLVSVFTTAGRDDAYNFVRTHGEGYDRVICCGGDGTADEVLNGIMALDRRPEFGVIPAGTTNDYAYNLNIPSNMEKAADIVAGDNTFDIDVGLYRERYFTYVAAFGIFTEVTYETPQDYKNLLGYIAYVLEGAKRLSAQKAYHARIEYDGGVFEGDYLLGLASNSISLAGRRTALKGSKLDDGLLEAVFIKAPSTLTDMQSLINILLDVEKITDAKSAFINAARTKSLRVTSSEPIAWTVDGENGGAHTDTVIRNVHKAVTVLRGTKKL